MQHSKILGAVCIVLSLSACFPRAESGCDVVFQQSSTWNIKGLEIPIKSQFIGTIMIGEVSYSREEAEKVSDTVRMLDQARMGNCSLVNSKHFHLLTPTTRDAIFLKAAEGYQAILDFGSALSKAKTAAEAKAAKEEADRKIREVQPPVSPSTAVSNVDTEARKAVAATEKTVKDLRKDVAQLSDGLDQVRRVGVQRIGVTGFAPNGAALLAEKRAALLDEVRQALAVVPANRTPNVLLVGYADGTGPSVYNADLALRRAASVAEFLRRHDFGRNFHTEVTSGGIFTQGDGEAARRVDIVVSRMEMVLALA